MQQTALTVLLLALLGAVPGFASDQEDGETDRSGSSHARPALEIAALNLYRGDGFDRHARLDGTELDAENGLLYSLEVSIDVHKPGRVTVEVQLEPEKNGPSLNKDAEYDLSGRGLARVGFPGLINLGSFGDDPQTAELTVRVEGERGGSDERELELALRGPKPPLVKVNEIYLIPNRGGTTDLLEPGEEFTAHIFYEVRRNRSGVEPELELFGLVDEDDFDPATVQPPGDYRASARVPGGEGIYQVTLSGRTPSYFSRYERDLHELKLITALWLGDDEPQTREARRTIYDRFSGRQRRPSVDYYTRPRLESGGDWEVERIDEDDYFDRLDELDDLLDELDEERRSRNRFDRFD